MPQYILTSDYNHIITFFSACLTDCAPVTTHDVVK